MVLTRGEFLENPNKWFDEHPKLVRELKQFCYDEIENQSDFYRKWMGKEGAILDKHYLELNLRVLKQKWKMQ